MKKGVENEKKTFNSGHTYASIKVEGKTEKVKDTEVLFLNYSIS